MNRDIIRLDKYTFKFEDIDLIYPVYIKCKDGEEYYNFRKSLTTSNIIFSRPYQLNHRSTQAQYFDLLLELNHFKLLGIDYNFITEMVLINTRPDIDPNRSYYLLDYFIPDLSLAIELDSSYHNSEYDKLKDQFLNSIGIDVVRIRDFNIGIKEKLESLVEYIKRKKEVKFELSYESLIEEYIKSMPHDELDHIRIKWKPTIKLFCSLDGGFKDAIINKKPYKLSFTLDEIWDLTREVLPMSRKQVEKYYPLINYLRKFGIEVEVKGGAKNQYTKLS